MNIPSILVLDQKDPPDPLAVIIWPHTTGWATTQPTINDSNQNRYDMYTIPKHESCCGQNAFLRPTKRLDIYVVRQEVIHLHNP